MPDQLPSDFLTTPEFAADPYRLTKELRERAPVHEINFPPGTQAFLVVGHEEVKRAFIDPRVSKDLTNAPEPVRRRLHDSSPVLIHNMITADPPEHTRLRKLVSGALTPRRMESMRPRIQEITDELLDALPGSGETDLLREFATPLPLTVICELLGVPHLERPKFREWAVLLNQSASVEGELARRRTKAGEEITDWFRDLVGMRRAEPRDDMTSELVTLADRNGGFTDDELVSTLVFLVIAGHETTLHLIGNGTLALLLHPDQMKLLRARPETIPAAVEEFLRFEGPVERGTLRFAAQDLEIGGTHIPKGSVIHLSVGAAGRDPAVFADPDRLDLERASHKHMAFGHGIHFCLGAPLARIEGHIAFETLLRRIPELELAVDPSELAWQQDSSIVHGLLQLPVRLRKAQG